MDEKELNELVDKTIAAVDAKVQPAEPVKADEPAAPAVETVTKEQAEQMAADAAKAAAAQAVKAMEARLIEARRPAYNAPAVVRKAGSPRPMWWAVKAALANPETSVILRDTADGEGVVAYAEKGDGAVKAFLSYARDARFDVEGNTVYGVKAMVTTASGATGEHFVERLNSRPVIEGLYQNVVSRQLPGVDIYPMPAPVCDAPSIGTFTAAWGAENTEISSGDATTGRKTLTARKLVALATLSREVLVDTNPGIEPYVQNGLRSAIGERHDIGAFQGTGSSNQPTGLLSEAGTTWTAIGSDNFFTAVVKALGRMGANKLALNNICVVMTPQAAVKAIISQVGASGDYVGSTGTNNGQFLSGGSLAAPLSARLGLPVFVTTAVPTVTSASSILVLKADEWTIGDRQELEIASSNQAGSAFAYDQTLIRAIMRVDFNLKRATALEVITGFTH